MGISGSFDLKIWVAIFSLDGAGGAGEEISRDSSGFLVAIDIILSAFLFCRNFFRWIGGAGYGLGKIKLEWQTKQQIAQKRRTFKESGGKGGR